MPERHTPEHQDDDRGDDEDVKEEEWEEGVQCKDVMEYGRYGKGRRPGGRGELAV
jgi:hypothetical protein